jgi:hypothetical protein
MLPSMRVTFLAIACAVAFSACKSDTKNLGTVKPQDRASPLVPGTLDALNRQGANCTPNTSGPTVCSTTNPSCTLTFDQNGDLTHLFCNVEPGYTFDCTRPCPGVYECVWSDDPHCADVYDAGGNHQYLCNGDLSTRVACSSDGGPAPDAGSDGGPGNDGGPSCRGLDQATCAATHGCEPISCGCNPPSYVGCFGPNDPKPGCASCVNCEGLDEHQCMATADCAPAYCPTCGGGQSYSGCLAAGQPHDCAPPPPNCAICMGLDETSCTANTACHAVYRDLGACGCAPVGCCIRFDHCADGAHADCVGPAACNSAPPQCEGDYVVAYANACYEGCVHAKECGGQPALCGAGGMWPTFDKTCMTDADCISGLHQTDCCGTRHAIGVSIGQASTFDTDEAICEAEWPGCACPTGPTLAEDGQSTIDPNRIHVRCQPGATPTSQCMTYVQ